MIGDLLATVPAPPPVAAPRAASTTADGSGDPAAPASGAEFAALLAMMVEPAPVPAAPSGTAPVLVTRPADAVPAEDRAADPEAAPDAGVTLADMASALAGDPAPAAEPVVATDVTRSPAADRAAEESTPEAAETAPVRIPVSPAPPRPAAATVATDARVSETDAKAADGDDDAETVAPAPAAPNGTLAATPVAVPVSPATPAAPVRAEAPATDDGASSSEGRTLDVSGDAARKGRETTSEAPAPAKSNAVPSAATGQAAAGPETSPTVRAVMLLLDALRPVAPKPVASVPAQGAAIEPVEGDEAPLPAKPAHVVLPDAVIRAVLNGDGGAKGDGNAGQRKNDAQGNESKVTPSAEGTPVAFTMSAAVAAGGDDAGGPFVGRSGEAAPMAASAGRGEAPVPTSHVTLDLDPAIGAGRIRVAVRGDAVHATIIATEQGAPTLGAQVKELQRALEERGFSEAHVSIRSTGDAPVTVSSAPGARAADDLRARESRSGGQQDESESHRSPRGQQRDATDQRSPRRRPRFQEEMA